MNIFDFDKAFAVTAQCNIEFVWFFDSQKNTPKCIQNSLTWQRDFPTYFICRHVHSQSSLSSDLKLSFDRKNLFALLLIQFRPFDDSLWGSWILIIFAQKSVKCNLYFKVGIGGEYDNTNIIRNPVVTGMWISPIFQKSGTQISFIYAGSVSFW